MARLSIIIPCLQPELLECTLLSVLEARHAADEVIVVDPAGYDDPYGLVGDEIELIDAPPNASLSELIGLGLRQCTSDRVNLLECGVRVTPNWCDPVVDWFDDPTVASVAPLIQLTDDEDDEAGWVVGIGWSATLNRTMIEVDSLGDLTDRRLDRVLGPTRLGGFYRRSLLCNTGSFCGSVAHSSADLDTALRLQAAGCDCVLESRSLLVAPAEMSAPAVNRFAAGRDAQRLIKMYGSQQNRLLARAATPAGLASDALLGFWSPSRWLSLCGRLTEIGFGQRAEDASWVESDATREEETTVDDHQSYRRAA